MNNWEPHLLFEYKSDEYSKRRSFMETNSINIAQVPVAMKTNLLVQTISQIQLHVNNILYLHIKAHTSAWDTLLR